VLFTKRFWEPIASGVVTVTYRRWKRPQAVPGRRYRTAAGILEVTAVDEVLPSDLAASLGRERAPFKLDVRMLKALGLTLSLEVGYRISPRGKAYLARRA
jgi:hypothetical protein